MTILETKPAARSRVQKVVPWATFVAILALMAVGRYTEYKANGAPDDGWLLDSLMGAAFMSFPGVGALIVSRQPRHRFGWLLLGIGAMASTLIVCTGYANLVFVVREGSNPFALLAAWIYNWMWFPLIFTVATFLFLLFPTGSYPSHRWRWVGRIAWFFVAFITLLTMFQGEIGLDDDVVIDNPIGIDAISDVEKALDPFFLAFLPVVLLSVLSLFFRYRSAGTAERQQLKWVALAAGLFALGLMTGDVIGLSELLFPVFLATIPVSMAISILKYRLYDIDVILNRALVYGLLTAILAGAYLAIVFALQLVLPLGRESDVAVAASTLAAAGLFRPLRRRVQAFIDRRFFRRKYDATATLETFATRLRSEVALEDVRRDVIDTVAVTMQPAHVTLWLRATS